MKQMQVTEPIQVTKSTKSQMKVANFKVCGGCGSSCIAKFDMDFFCMDCEWNTILFDVYSGNFEKRIGLNARNRAAARAETPSSSVILLADLANEQNGSPVEVDAPSTPLKSKKFYETA